MTYSSASSIKGVRPLLQLALFKRGDHCQSIPAFPPPAAFTCCAAPWPRCLSYQMLPPPSVNVKPTHTNPNTATSFLFHLQPEEELLATPFESYDLFRGQVLGAFGGGSTLQKVSEQSS